jgi:hypothetical protein
MISVRENYAVDIAYAVFGVKAQVVMDPVFLPKREIYTNLIKSSEWQNDDNYLAIFYLDPTHEKRKVAEAVADKLGLDKIVILPNPDSGRKLSKEIFSGERFIFVSEDSVENFLAIYKNANYVVTDSFHGTAFSIIFERPFSTIYNIKRGEDRFVNLLDFFKFGNSRRIYETDNTTTIAKNNNVTTDLNFTVSNEVLNTNRELSLAWLKNALYIATQNKI